MIEFVIRMPLDAKMAIPRYKYLLRAGAQGLLPDLVRDRSDIGSHPGWTFFERLGRCFAAASPNTWDCTEGAESFGKWIGSRRWYNSAKDGVSSQTSGVGIETLRAFILFRWIESNR